MVTFLERNPHRHCAEQSPLRASPGLPTMAACSARTVSPYGALGVGVRGFASVPHA